MAEDISGFGVSVLIRASNTFPVGLLITEFADDADPLDAPALEITNSAMGVNGNKINWTVANSIPMTINVITNTENDRNLSTLFESNRAGRGKVSAKDTVIAVIGYADGSITTLTGGSCDSFIPAKSISSEGRFKSNAYVFSFENRVSI